MAALCTGNYGLSQNCTDDSKEYFFVKLTDSAYRAVEEYQKNQNKYNTHATIQIIGNGGVLSFPTVGGNVGQQFSFSIDEIEGSFECIRQTQNQLDVLGALPYKMRIHANDDVYETTRYRMAVAEETQKNKCTREIKPNQTDIGRKVKLKNPINRPSNIPPKRDNLVNSSSLVSSSSSSNNVSSSSNSNTNSSLNSLPLSSYLTGSNHISSLSPISSLNGNCNNNNNNLNNSSNNISSSNNLTTASTIGNHHSSSSINSSSAATTNHHSSGTLKNSSSSSSSSNILNNLSHSSSSSKLLSGFTSANGLTPGISSASSLSSALSSAAGSGTSGINNGYFNNNSRTGNSNSGSRRGLSNLTGNSSSNRSQKNISRHMPDITKRKIRERLIHLLALKPFKKPELYSRLQNEGIREKERGLISGILKEIATMRDNTYNLKRQIWNDVNEDWPFYTEQELQMLKRRKPQNLTPPLSSDGGSSTSGQSPTSTHNGSPPPAVKRPSLDRERFHEEPVPKKQRISHFRKETNEISRRTGGITNSRDSNLMNSRSSRENRDIRSSSNYFGSNSNKHHLDTEDNAMGSLSYAVLGNEAARRISPRDELSAMMMNGHISNNINNNNSNNNSSNSSGHYNQNNSHHHSYHHNNHHSTNSSNNLKDNLSYNGVNVRQQSPSLYNSKGNSNNSSNHHSNSNISSSSSNNNQNNNNGTMVNGDSHSMNPRKSDSPSSPTLGTLSNSISPASPNRASIGITDGGASGGVGVNVVGSNSGGIMRTNSPMSGLIERGSAINNNSNSINQGCNNSNNINSNGNGNSNIINSNCSMNMNMNMNNSTNNGTIGGPLTNNTYDFSRFTKITSVEQRRLYKTEFESDYDEYRKLLHKIESVGQRFQILAKRLNNARNDDANYKLIKKQIVSEYEKINREQEHQKAKARFDYLHAKLAHIKALVSDFDEQLKSSLSSASSSQQQQQQNQSIGGIISDNRINSNNGSRILSQLSPSNANNSSANNNVNNNSNCINNGNINYSSSSSNNNNSSSSNNNLLRTSSPLSHNFSSSPSRLSSSGSSVIIPSSSSSTSSSNGLSHTNHENY